MNESPMTLDVRHTTSLIRLYLNWPERVAQMENEAAEFNTWLHKNYADLSVVQRFCSVENITSFLEANDEVIEACRCLKVEKSASDNVRQGQRVSLVAQAFLVVYDCQAEPSLIGSTLRSVIVDVSETGIGLEIANNIPVGSMLSVTIVPPGTPLNMFNLSAEVRWCIEKSGDYQAGLKFFDIDDFDKWQSNFISQFMPR